MFMADSSLTRYCSTKGILTRLTANSAPDFSQAIGAGHRLGTHVVVVDEVRRNQSQNSRLVAPGVGILQRSQRREIADRVCQDYAPFHGQTRRDSRHVLFRNADIQELARKSLCKVIQDPETQISGDQEDSRIALGDL